MQLSFSENLATLKYYNIATFEYYNYSFLKSCHKCNLSTLQSWLAISVWMIFNLVKKYSDFPSFLCGRELGHILFFIFTQNHSNKHAKAMSLAWTPRWMRLHYLELVCRTPACYDTLRKIEICKDCYPQFPIGRKKIR